MFKDCVLWVVTNLLLSSAANQTTKPVFDAILEATGENGKTSGKSFDDRKVIFGRAKAGSETEYLVHSLALPLYFLSFHFSHDDWKP